MVAALVMTSLLLEASSLLVATLLVSTLLVSTVVAVVTHDDWFCYKKYNSNLGIMLMIRDVSESDATRSRAKMRGSEGYINFLEPPTMGQRSL